MFSYYGRKTKLAKYYPKPIYSTIIEPFAGSAAYSLHGDNWKKDVILIEKDQRLVLIWQYLQMATPEMILSLPKVQVGQDIRTLPEYNRLRNPEKWLMGFGINPGSSTPKNVAGKFNQWESEKKKIADNLHKIKHWKICLGNYDDLDIIIPQLGIERKITYFIDPPYQGRGGKWYKSEFNNKNIDYIKLAEWCKSLKGQVIVCENSEATWLPFKPLVELKGQLHNTEEVIYYQET